MGCALDGDHGPARKGLLALKIDYAVSDRDQLTMFPAGTVDGIKGIVRQTVWVSHDKARSERVGELVEPKLVGNGIQYLPKPYHHVKISRPDMTYNYDLVTRRGSRAPQGMSSVPGDNPGAMVGVLFTAAAAGFPRVDPPVKRRFLGIRPTCHQIPPPEREFIECGGEIHGYSVTLYATRRGTYDPTTRVSREAVSAEMVCVSEALFSPEEGIKWR